MLTAVLLLLERLGSEGLQGLGQGLCALGLAVKYERGPGTVGLVARQSWRLQRFNRFTGRTGL